MKLLKIVKRVVTQIELWFYYYIFKFKVVLFYPNIQIGRNLKVIGFVNLQVSKNSTVQIGDNVIFCSLNRFNFVGLIKNVSIHVSEGAVLRIGNNSGFSGSSIYVAQSIEIGNYVNFGGNTFIWDTDFHPLDFAQRRNSLAGTKTSPIRIGNDVFIGANSIILKGCFIGDKVIVGAGSVISKNIGCDEVWGGNPARRIRGSIS
jgi:acetyltransferase-like isoleucine patch superfamily enzyme